MSKLPPRLEHYLEGFALLEDRSERIQLLIETADRFQDVPPSVASRPFANDHLVPHCESDAYTWVTMRSDGTLDLYFAVENPQGISARAMAVILKETLSGEPPEAVARIPSDLPYAFFGRELSMGKTMGLTGMVAMVRNQAVRLAAQSAEARDGESKPQKK